MRPLRADEIEVRIGTINKKGVTMLLYKNARVDMAILDETYGEFGWQNKYEERKNIMYCSIGVLNEASGEWVWKEDCGTESFTEKEKGEASDAFKRAGFRWGVGRELYTGPRIFLEAATQQKQDGRGYELVNPYEFYGVYVSNIRTVDHDGKLMITELELAMDVYGKPKPIFNWRKEK